MSTKHYDPGSHVLCTFRAGNDRLTEAENCRHFFDALIAEAGLNKVGEVYHSFGNGGFTAVVCLVESHISIHTWPEFGLATFDVFLSNFNNDNSSKVKLIYERTLAYFDGTEENTQHVKR